MNLDHILNWKLRWGSHDFPGPDGGTCINEAAIVAAGFPYKAVSSASDCPPCFSRVLSAHLIRLNDRMPDHERHRLLPFVMRLSGSRDADAVEIKRARYIAVETVRRLLPAVLKARFPDHAAKCAAIEPGSTRQHASAAAAAAAAATGVATAAAYAGANAAASAASVASAAASAASAAYVAKAAAYAANTAWSVSVEIAEGAFAIGKQAEPLDTALVIERMERAKLEAAHA